uniref:Uncharacterized protein n=1 Tax=Hyaloperonospora arabidopsidis (strain Emoy2) TaxID=559515 RepID=M4BF45_HYAAE
MSWVKSDSCGVGSGQVARKRQHIAGIDTDIPAHVVMSRCTSEYQTNRTSEDRNVNVVRTTDAGIRINAEFESTRYSTCTAAPRAVE